jgi:thioredoxin 1
MIDETGGFEQMDELEQGITQPPAAPDQPDSHPSPDLQERTGYAPAGRGSRTRFVFVAAAAVLLIGGALFYFLYLGRPGRQALAEINGEKITVEQFDKELAKIEEPVRDMYREEPGKFLEMVIMQRLILQEAKKQAPSSPVKTYKDNVKDEKSSSDEGLVAQFMEKKFSSPAAVTREEVEAFYGMFKERMGGKPLKEVAPLIEQVIQQSKQQQAVEDYLKEIRNTAKVEIDQGRLQKITAKPPESNSAEEFKKAVAAGKPILVDFGANSCLPCRQMRPVLKELEKESAGKASILVIDVYKYQNLARDYQVQLIPTLVFLDSKGKEVFRHVGALEKDKIAAKLKEIGGI